MLLSHQSRSLIFAFGALLGALAPSSFAQAEDVDDLLAAGRYDEALAPLRKVEQQWAAAVRKDDSLEYRLGWARTLQALGMVEDRLSLWDEAIAHLQHARQLADEAKAGPHFLGDCLDALGRAQHHAGQLVEAEATLLKAIEERTKLPEATREPWLSASKDHLGLLYLESGRYEKSGQLFHESLKAAGKDDKVLAQRHGYLGRYYHALRSYAVARDHFEQALKSAESEWGRNHATTISLIGSLGLTHLRLAARKDGLGVVLDHNDFLKARNSLTEAATLAEQLPQTHQTTLALATYLTNLGHLALLEEKFEEARDIFTKSLETLTPRLGDNHPALAPFWNNIGFANQRLGEFEKARNAFYQAKVRYRYSVGVEHQRYIEANMNLVTNYLLDGTSGVEASDLVKEATASALTVFDRLLAFGTERQRLNYLERVDLVSLPCSLGDDHILIADLVLRTKSRLLDSLLAEEDNLNEASQQLRAKQQQLDNLLFSSADREQLSGLREEIRTLEQAIQAAAPDTPEGNLSALTWKDVQGTLPPRSAFIDYVRYRNYQVAAEGPAHYGAVLILPSGEPRWVPLGSEEELKLWLGVMKERLNYRAARLSGDKSTPPPLKLDAALQELYSLFFTPLEQMLPPGTETLGLSPDGWLNFVSFAVLLDDYNQFLASKFRQLVYLASGRDLLVNEERPSFRDGRWDVIAVAEFEDPVAGPPGKSPSALDQVVLEMIEPFRPVPGALDEMKRIRRVIPNSARGMEMKNAEEGDLRKLQKSPVVLHLTTHGFFLPTVRDESLVSTVQQDFDQHPEVLYRAGLVLTEAKRALSERTQGKTIPVSEDGILFPNEVKSLPLENTRLVTLSSCESGLGEVSGEGVLGLRRGFTLAGTTNVLLSLWPVSDSSTPKFMEQLYRLVLETDRVAQPVWEMQRHSLREIDPAEEDDLEEAVLRYGCFVLSQRGPLQPAIDMPEIPDDNLNRWWITVAGVTGAMAIFFLWPRKKRREVQFE